MFISSSFMKSGFAGHRIHSLYVFSVSALNMAFDCLLSSMIFHEELVLFVSSFPIHDESSFSCCFQDFPLWLLYKLSSSTKLCLGVSLCVYFTLGFLNFLELWINVFLKFEKFFTNYFLKYCWLKTIDFILIFWKRYILVNRS